MELLIKFGNHFLSDWQKCLHYKLAKPAISKIIEGKGYLLQEIAIFLKHLIWIILSCFKIDENFKVSGLIDTVIGVSLVSSAISDLNSGQLYSATGCIISAAGLSYEGYLEIVKNRVDRRGFFAASLGFLLSGCEKAYLHRNSSPPPPREINLLRLEGLINIIFVGYTLLRHISAVEYHRELNEEKQKKNFRWFNFINNYKGKSWI